MTSSMRKIGILPAVGYGTWNRAGQVAYDGVRAALDAGYRHIDTAEGYGNEAEVGRAIADSGVPRQDIFLVTKVSPENLGPGNVRVHAEASLEKLRVDAVDLFLIHWPAIKDAFALDDTMAQLADVHDAGLTRHIGVANFTKRHIDAALKRLPTKAIATNQVEIHALMQNRPIVEHCRAKGIPLTAYSPLARGLVSHDPVLIEIGTRHGATPEQIALAFLLAEGHVVIPSSATPSRIAQNFAAKDLVLTPDEITRIRSIDAGRRVVNGDWCPVWDV